MFALVVFTLTFLAVLTHVLSRQAPELADGAGAGYDLLVDSSAVNPVTAGDLGAVPGVEEAIGLARGAVDVQADAIDGEVRPWAVTGFDEGLLARAPPRLSSRGPYDSDADAWRAVLEDPTLAIVSPVFLQQSSAPTDSLFEPGDRFEVLEPATGVGVELTVAGVTSSDFQVNGVLVGRTLLDGLLGPNVVVNRHYVAVADGADPEVVASTLEGQLAPAGIDASTFRAVVDEALAAYDGFLRLLQGFLSLGLVTGIAGLGVVLVRAVRERRREIGVLRAVGVRPEVVRNAFLVEAGFLAVQGTVLGVALGLVSGASVLAHADLFGTASPDFAVPWAALVVVLVVPLVCSLLAAAVPASRAAAIRPAVALRGDA